MMFVCQKSHMQAFAENVRLNRNICVQSLIQRTSLNTNAKCFFSYVYVWGRITVDDVIKYCTMQPNRPTCAWQDVILALGIAIYVSLHRCNIQRASLNRRKCRGLLRFLRVLISLHFNHFDSSMSDYHGNCRPTLLLQTCTGSVIFMDVFQCLLSSSYKNWEIQLFRRLKKSTALITLRASLTIEPSSTSHNHWKHRLIIIGCACMCLYVGLYVIMFVCTPLCMHQ